MFKSFTKIIAISLITAMNWSGLSAVFGTVAYFTDSVEVTGITITAGSLDFSASGAGFASTALLPDGSNAATQTISLANTGSLGLQYRIAPQYDAADPLCGNLLIRDDSTTTFELLASYAAATGTLEAGVSGERSFEIKLSPAVAEDASLQNRRCDLVMEITAWQLDFSQPTQGFIKTQTIADAVITGQWTPSLLSPANNAVINGAFVKQCWTPVAGATAYYYQSCDDASCSVERYHTAYTSGTELATACKTASGVGNAAYYWHVRAIIGSYTSPFSGTHKITIDNTLADQVVLNEILPNPSNSGEWVELHNNTGQDVDVAGWFVGANAGSLVISSSNTYSGTTLLRSGGFLVARIAGFSLNDYGDTVYLKNAAETIIDSYTYDSSNKESLTGTPGYPNVADSSGTSGGVPVDKSLARIPDGAANWVDPIPTPGEPNELSNEEIVEILKELQAENLMFVEQKGAKQEETPIGNGDDAKIVIENIEMEKAVDGKSDKIEDNTTTAADTENPVATTLEEQIDLLGMGSDGTGAAVPEVTETGDAETNDADSTETAAAAESKDNTAIIPPSGETKDGAADSGNSSGADGGNDGDPSANGAVAE